MKKRNEGPVHPKVERIRLINSDLDSYMKGLRTRETDKKASKSFLKRLLSRKAPKKEQFVEVEPEVVPLEVPAEEKPAKVTFNEQLEAPQKQTSPFAFLAKLFQREPEDVPIEKLPVFEEKKTEVDEEIDVEEPELKAKHQAHFKKVLAKHARKVPHEVFEEEVVTSHKKTVLKEEQEIPVPRVKETAKPVPIVETEESEPEVEKKSTLLESISSWMNHRETKHQEKEEKFKEEVVQEIEKKELKAPSRIHAAHEHMAELEEEFKKDLAEFDRMEDEMKDIDKKYQK